MLPGHEPTAWPLLPAAARGFQWILVSKKVLLLLQPLQTGPGRSSATHWVPYQQPYGHLYLIAEASLLGMMHVLERHHLDLKVGAAGPRARKEPVFFLNRLAREKRE